jgi:hypothetical protein
VSKPLPSRPSLEYLRRQARDLLRAVRSGDSAASIVVVQHLPQAITENLVLAQALHVIARQHGFGSWPLLKTHVEALAAGRRQLERERRQASQLRRQAEALRIAELADRLAAAAARQDLKAVFDALVLGARVGDAVRANLLERGLFGSVVDTLLLGAGRPEPRVRFLTAQAMDHWADERCAGPLRAMLHDPVPRVRWAALHSLQCEACKLAPIAAQSDMTEELIRLALHDPSAKVRRVATYELGEACTNERARAALEQLAQDSDSTVRRNAQRALKRTLPNT